MNPEPFVAEVARAQVEGDGIIRGVASTVGNVDRMRRVFLPGAFGSKPIRVPLLAYHDDQRPIGSSVLTPQGASLTHESTLAKTPFADEIRELIRAGGIPATSIGWLSEDRFFGWSRLQLERPELARQAANLGVPQAEDITYYASAEIVENSVVPVPANPHALISAASLLRGKQRGMIEGLLQLSAGARHSSSDQAALQRAHDAVVEAGARCTVPLSPGEDESGEPAARDGLTGGWADNMRAAMNGRQQAQATRDLVSTLDDVIDQALEALQQGNAAEALSQLQAADSTVDDLMAAMSVPDPDEDEASGRDGIETAAQWTSAYINDLPDSAFLHITDGGDKDDEGKTTPRDLRHFPYKDAAGKVDVPHLRNALARIPQSDLPADVKDGVMAKAQRIAKQNGIDEAEGASVPSLDLPELEELDRQLAELTR